MTNIVFRKRRRKIYSLLRGCQYFFLVLGLSALGYFGFSLLNMAWFQAHETRAFEQALERETGTRAGVSPARRKHANRAPKPG